MDRFVRRYELDRSRPTRTDAVRDALRRAFAPSAVLWVLIVGLGLLIVGPFDSLPQEAAVNEALVEVRTPTLDAVTHVLSTIGTTEFIIGGCLVAFALLWWRTRQWWFAAVPALAVSVQALIFLTSSLVVGRGRPEVEQLEDSPPTSGYPSGHAGAATAFYVTLALVAQRITHPALRAVVTGLCLLVPVSVGFARLYMGMHHVSDVVVGVANGLACTWLGWRYLRRDTAGRPAERGRAARQTRA